MVPRLQKVVTALVESHLDTLKSLVSEFREPDAVQIHFARHLRDFEVPIEIRGLSNGKYSHDAFVDAIDEAILKRKQHRSSIESSCSRNGKKYCRHKID